jgi:hypothetical protein
MEQTYALDQRNSLSRAKRWLLLLPLAASAFVGLFQYLLPGLLAKLTGYSGNDVYIYQLSGAATFSYACALGLGLRQGRWSEVRLVIIAFFTFGLGSLYACAADIVSGSPQPAVYVVLALTLVFVTITGTLLYRHRGAAKGSPDTGRWLAWVIGIAIVPALVFGLVPLLVPQVFSTLFMLKGTDVFIFRQAGAATLGYAVMGFFELRSRNWQEIRWPLAMDGIFNGLSLIVTVLALGTGSPLLMALLVLPVTIGVTTAAIVAFRRKGK